MKLWLISQTENTGYDTYDSAVVVAETEENAKRIYPQTEEYVAHAFNSEGQLIWIDTGRLVTNCAEWATHINKVTAEYIGDTTLEAGTVICASFNAG